MRQLEFALFDFRLHAEYDPARGARIAEIARRRCGAKSPSCAPPAWNRFPHSFGHIFAGGYAAGYYSYKWAEVLSADAFGAFEEAGVFDRGDGAALPATAILARGGSRDALDAFVEFRGRKPDDRAAAAADGPRGLSDDAPDDSIATWNVNSLRVRLPQLRTGSRRTRSDVVALQETKLPDADFPAMRSSALGMHAVFSGQQTYNGVAMLSRAGPPTTWSPTSRASRTSSGACSPRRVGGVRVINLYVPNGQAVGSDKFALQAALARRRCATTLAAELRAPSAARRARRLQHRARGPRRARPGGLGGLGARERARARGAARARWAPGSSTASGCSSSRRSRFRGGTTG